MHYIAKIQSISDIITNSSSEVFIIPSDSSSYFSEVVHLTNVEDVINHWVSNYYLDEHPEAKPEDLVGYSIVTIEDHHDGWEMDCDIAREFCIWSFWNH